MPTFLKQILAPTDYCSAPVSKSIHACLFKWLISVINDSLAGKDDWGALLAEPFIGVLNICRFEHYPYKGLSRGGSPSTIANSFEQFSINYTNEKLQQEESFYVLVEYFIPY